MPYCHRQTLREDILDLAHTYHSTTPARSRAAFPIPGATGQPRRSHRTVNAQLPLMDFDSVLNSLPNGPLFSLKKCVFPLFPGLAYSFDTACFSLIPEQTHLLLVKITGSFTFKVHMGELCQYSVYGTSYQNRLFTKICPERHSSSSVQTTPLPRRSLTRDSRIQGRKRKKGKK